MAQDSAWELELFITADQLLSVTFPSSTRETVKCHKFLSFLPAITNEFFCSKPIFSHTKFGVRIAWYVTPRTGVSEEISPSIFREEE